MSLGGFVEGLGPAQFAERETVDRLRFLGQKPAGARGSGTGIVLDLKDPADLGLVHVGSTSAPAPITIRNDAVLALEEKYL